MVPKNIKIPGVLLLILSALGILFWGSLAVFNLASICLFPSTNYSTTEVFSIITTGFLSLLLCALNIPTFITVIWKLRQKPSRYHLPSLFRIGNYLIVFWLIVILIGYFLSQEKTAAFFLAPLTIAAVSIPIFWLVEFARRGLPRSTRLREWGTLSLGLTITPIIIIIVELSMVVTTIIVVMIGLGFQAKLNGEIIPFLLNIKGYPGGIEGFERTLYDLMKNPIISSGAFLAVGLLVPLIEEIFKPMAIWLLLKRPLKEYEGFSLGLVSGGAFALLESAGMVMQINVQDWLSTIALRTVTDVLHIGLSGFVGYGLTQSWNQKKYWRGIMYVFSAALLHGGWNTLALLSGFSSTITQGGSSFATSVGISILILGLMAVVFFAVITIMFKINSYLRNNIATQTI